MSYPDRSYFEKERVAGATFVTKYMRDHVVASPSIGRHHETGEPWPAFHRCSICGEHPEVRGERCVKARGQNICESCVNYMRRAMDAVELPFPGVALEAP